MIVRVNVASGIILNRAGAVAGKMYTTVLMFTKNSVKTMDKK